MWHPLFRKLLYLATIFEIFLITSTISQKLIVSENLVYNKFAGYVKNRRVSQPMLYLRKNSDSSEKTWPNMEVCSRIPKCIDELVVFVEYQFKEFENDLSVIISNSVKNYFKTEVEKAKSLQSIQKLEGFLIDLKNELTTKKKFEQLLDKISGNLLNEREREEIKNKKSKLDSFTSLLQKQHNFPKEKIWINQNHIIEINDLIEELKQYNKQTESNLSEDTFTVSGFFCSMSQVLSKLQQSTDLNNKMMAQFLSKFPQSINIINLKLIQIFATNSFDFDVDFSLPEYNYATNHPDLVIISPYLVFSKPVTINLITKKVPGYPDNKAKAQNGRGIGDSGDNGKPGLPGYNSGNLAIYAETIVNADNMKFVSVGGNGGPGQEGGDGIDGKKGRTILSSETNQICASDKSKCVSFEYYMAGRNYQDYYPKEGIPGSKGGDSGKPGRGGYEGFGGSANLFTKDTHIVQTGSLGSRGLNGKPGKAGLGGEYGDIIKSFPKMEEYGYNGFYDKTILTYKRGPNGLVNEDLNEEGIAKSSKSITEFYERETDYLKFIIKLNPNFKLSKLIDRKFAKQLIQMNFFKPNVEQFIDRFFVLNNYQSKHLLNDLKNELIDYFSSTKLERDDQQAFNYTYTAIASAIYRYESLDQKALVVDIKSFLESTIEQINNWKNLAQQSAREVYKTNYKNNLKNKIDEANSFVGVLTKDIEENEKNINRIIKSIISEIKELQNSAFKNDSLLRSQKDELEKMVLIKKFFSAVKIGCQVLSFLGPEAQLAGSLIESGIGIGKMFVPETIQLPDININPSIDNALKGVFEKIEKHKEKQFQNIENELERLEKETQGNVQKEKSLYERIDSLPDSVFKYELKIKYSNYIKKDTTDSKKIEQADKSKQDAEEKLAKEKSKLASVQKITDKIPNVVDTIKIAKEVYDEFGKADQELEIMSQAIAANVKNFENLNNLEDKMIEFENVVIKNLQNQLNDLSKNLKGSSIASLEFSKWNTKRILDEFKDFVSQTLGSFSQNTEMITTINRIDSSFTTMVTIYSKIESYMEQNEFASYISDITQKEMAIGIPVKYQSKINELRKSIHANVIMDRYQQAIEAFQYWSFPFFCQYTSDLVIYDTREDNFKNTDEMIGNYANCLSNLLNKIRNFDTLLRPAIDNNIQGFSFENDFPFYQWSSLKFPIEVKQLLNGKKTTFLANLDEDNEELFDAIKFCTLYLKIETKNSVKNEQLNNLLKKFFVELTHSGISNYRLNKNKYTIEMNFNSGEKLKLRYPYGSTDSNNANDSFKKLSANKPILSPYTFWDIELVAINKKNEYNLLHELSVLINGENEVVVSLNGKGQYLVSNGIDAGTCQSNFKSNNMVQSRRIG